MSSVQTQPRSVIICSVPRSGSWLLAEMLEVSGQCGHPREYFRPDYEAIYAREWGLPQDYSFEDFLTGVRVAGSTDNAVLGLKLHWTQYQYLLRRLRAATAADTEDGLAVLARHFPRPTFLRLRRKDKAAQAVSWFRAIQADRWWDVGDGASDDALPPEPDLTAIAQLEKTLLEHDRNWDELFARDPHPCVFVDYGDLCSDYASTAQSLMAALELPVERAPSRPERLRKQADALSEDWIERYLSRREELLCEPSS